MSYWPSESAALPECHAALMGFLPRLVDRGQMTARRMYGCRGFVAHHTSDLWADTAPTGGVYASALWPFGGAWLALHAWEHFLYGRNTDFLRRTGYRILREAALFFSDYLTANSRGELVAVPSVSPENFFVLPTGGTGKACAGAAMDGQILRELFGAAIEASKILEVDEPARKRWKRELDSLPAVKTRPDGTLQEWEDFSEDVDPGHRHLSHLFALFPGSLITPETLPDAEAARRTLERKLAHPNNRTGWSQAWMVNLFARLGLGEDAAACIDRIIEGFTHPSLMGNCPPLNLDSNFGLCSGIAEMLVQSHGGTIRLLPALPSAWKSGEVRGLRARGGIALSIRWIDGQLLSARLVPTCDMEVVILSPAPLLHHPSLVPEASERGARYRTSLKAGKPLALEAARP
jgi:alpha-L-fucosidase 2